MSDDTDDAIPVVATRVQPNPTAPPYQERTCSAAGGTNTTGYDSGYDSRMTGTSESSVSTEVVMKGEQDQQNDAAPLILDDDHFFDCVDLKAKEKHRKFRRYDKVVITGGTKYGASEVCTVMAVKKKMVDLMDREGNQFSKQKKYVRKVAMISKVPQPAIWLGDVS